MVCGIAVGLQAGSITAIWDWLMMVLGPAFLVPNVLRWYWWRFNGWGVVGSLTSGIFACMLLTFFFPGAPIYISLSVIVTISLVAAIAATLLTPPTDAETLRSFYLTVRPGGFWRPIRGAPGAGAERARSDSFGRDLFNTAVGAILVISLYLTAIYAVIHHWAMVWGLVTCAAVAVLVLWKTWYPYLPED